MKTHDFPDQQLGKAIPYGVYDIAADSGWVSVGDHDTAAFAVATIRRWWQAVGADRYPHAEKLLITADAGLQRLSHPAVEDRTRRAGRRGRAREHRLPLPTRHLEVEQDRAPAVLPYLVELARPDPGQPRGRGQPDRGDITAPG